STTNTYARWTHRWHRSLRLDGFGARYRVARAEDVQEARRKRAHRIGQGRAPLLRAIAPGPAARHRERSRARHAWPNDLRVERSGMHGLPRPRRRSAGWIAARREEPREWRHHEQVRHSLVEE